MSEIKPAVAARPGVSWMLIIAAFGLWVPLFLLAAMLFSGVGSYGAVLAVGTLLVLALKAGAISIVILLLYAILAKPWRGPGWERALFFWQIPAVVLVCLGGIEALPYYMEDLEHQTQLAQRSKRYMNLFDALSKDDASRFEQLLTACSKDCKGPWLDSAVSYEAVQTAAVLLKKSASDGVTSDPSQIRLRSGCVDQTRYDIPLSLAGLVALHNNPGMLAQFQPHWSRADIQQALHGAVAGNHVELMQTLVGLGADPLEHTDRPEDSLVVAGIRAGAIDALTWLSEHGVRVHDDGKWQDRGQAMDSEPLHAWHSVDQWIRNVSLKMSAQHLDALLDALQALGMDPAPQTAEGFQPLNESVQPHNDGLSITHPNGILAQALLRHGAHQEFLDQDARRALQDTLAEPASTYAEDDMSWWCKTRRKGEVFTLGWPVLIEPEDLP